MIIQSNHSLEGRSMKWMRFLRCLALVLSLVAVSDGALYAQVPFYQGKTITVIVSSDAGDTSDLRVKSLVPYLQKYIPGNPTIVLEYMPGGGGRKAANHFYTAKPDGLKIASAGAMIPGPILGLPGSNYDIDKFPYIGSTETGNPYILFTRKAAGLDTLDKVRRAS